MKFAAAEGKHPLEDLDWTEHYSFPRELLQVKYCDTKYRWWNTITHYLFFHVICKENK